MSLAHDLSLLLLGVAAGLGAHAAWSPDPPAPEARQATAPSTPTTADVAAPAVATCPEATQRALDLQARWAAEVDTTCADRVRAAGGAVPVPFPDDLPDTFRPDAVTAAIATALSGCPAADDLDITVDCSEFPCVTLARGPGRVSDCPGLPTTHHHRWRTAPGGDDGARLSLVSHLPHGLLDDDEVLRRDVNRRLDARFDAAASWYAGD